MPAAAPCIIARNLLLTSLIKNTTAEPTRVHSQVKIPAKSACKIGDSDKNHSIISPYKIPINSIYPITEKFAKYIDIVKI